MGSEGPQGNKGEAGAPGPPGPAGSDGKHVGNLIRIKDKLKICFIDILRTFKLLNLFNIRIPYTNNNLNNSMIP